MRSTLRLTPSGFGLAKLGDEDVFVGSNALGPALDGDEVELEISSRTAKGPRGRVLRVTARNPRRLCGTLDDEGRFIADDPRLHRPLVCDAGGASTDTAAALLGGELLLSGTEGGAELVVVRSFGVRGQPRAEEDAILWREGLTDSFPAAALAEAEAVSRPEANGYESSRADFTELAFVTIDPATAEDHDDALFARRLEDGRLQVYVAIADVSAFVLAGTALDVEACRRGASLYFPGRVVPMLPPILSSGVASLLPDVDRRAMVLELELDTSGQVLARRVVRAVIRSRARLTYEDAALVLTSNGERGSERAKSQGSMILLLDGLAQQLRGSRRGRGAVIVDAHEVVIETEPSSGLPIRIAHPMLDPGVARAHQLVEELMLLANETVGSMLCEHGTTILFRSHEPPSEIRALRVVDAARRLGIDIDDGVTLDTTQLRDLIQELPDPLSRAQLSALLLEAMPTALYAAGRENHFALASSHYVHFTSPIRRYADLTIHRALEALLLGRAPNVEMDPEVVNSSQRRARAIQREVSDLYAALLMQPRIGEEYAGTLAHVAKSRCFVALDAPAISVRCARPPGQLELGMKLMVRVEAVSLATRTVEAVVVRTVDP